MYGADGNGHVRKNSTNSDGWNRRKVLKNIGATAATGVALGGAVGTGAATSPANTVVRLEGEQRDKYVTKAFSDITSQGEFSELTNRVSRRGYSVGTDGALVTQHVNKETINVLLPLTDERDRLSIDAISDYGEGATFGHVLWKSDSSNATAFISGDAEALTDGLGFVSNSSLPDDGAGVEVIGPDRHEIELSIDFSEPAAQPIYGPRQADADAGVTFVHIDITAENVRTPQPTLEPSAVRAARTSCPDSIPVILTALGTCGASCSTCASAGFGNLPALFLCIACAGCGCGLGCCIGERSSAACSFASTVLAAPFLFGGGTVAAASCVNEGCNNNSCF